MAEEKRDERTVEKVELGVGHCPRRPRASTIPLHLDPRSCLSAFLLVAPDFIILTFGRAIQRRK